jgi:ribonuclease D
MEIAYINSNYHCRNPYRHRAETIEELSNTIFTGKENSSPNGTSQVNLKRLAKWREHTAKMKDESVEYILPTKILKQIILRDIKSMLELRYLYSEYEEKEVNRDSMSEIIGILLEKKKKFDPEKMQEEVERCLDQPEMLFKEAGWMDKEWRNNDFESLKLYKEIISMKELEPSIIESELNSTESKTLSNGQLMCLFQYAKNWEDPSLLKHYYKEFKENRFDNEEQSDLNGKPSKPEE